MSAPDEPSSTGGPAIKADPGPSPQDVGPVPEAVIPPLAPGPEIVERVESAIDARLQAEVGGRPASRLAAAPAVDPWTRTTKDYWFFAALAAATVAMITILSSYINVMLFAVVAVVVTWPIYQRVLRRVRGRRALAAVLCMLLLGAVIFGPIGLFTGIFVQQAIVVVGRGVTFVNSGGLASWIDWVAALPEAYAAKLPPWMMGFVPEDFSVQQTVAGPVQDGALAMLNAAGAAVPSLFSSTVTAGLDVMIFLFAVPSLYIDGPAVLRVIKNLLPMEDDYEDRLFAVFAELCNNMVIGALATAAAMAVVAGVGYAIAGVDRVFFFAVLTGVMSFIPVVGTAIVWIPLSIMVGVQSGWGWGVFLALWSILITSNVDTFIRPMFMRGSTNIHPLLVFLSAFGGMAWMGLPGALVGPVIVAFFVALYTIYVDDYLGGAVKPTPPVTTAG